MCVYIRVVLLSVCVACRLIINCKAQLAETVKRYQKNLGIFMIIIITLEHEGNPVLQFMYTVHYRFL